MRFTCCNAIKEKEKKKKKILLTVRRRGERECYVLEPLPLVSQFQVHAMMCAIIAVRVGTDDRYSTRRIMCVCAKSFSFSTYRLVKAINFSPYSSTCSTDQRERL